MSGREKQGGKRQSRMAWALALSLVFHLGLAAGAGVAISDKRPQTLRMEVDLRLLAPAKPRPAKPEPRPAPPRKQPEKEIREKPRAKKPQKPMKKPEPVPVPPKPVTSTQHHKPSITSPPAETKPAKPRPISRSLLISYQRIIYQRINQAKRYPRQARMNREEGTVKVRFTIAASGAVSGVRVAQSSGFVLLDRAAEDAVKRAAPFPPLPAEIGRSELVVTVPIRFALR